MPGLELHLKYRRRQTPLSVLQARANVHPDRKAFGFALQASRAYVIDCLWVFERAADERQCCELDATQKGPLP